MKPPQPASTAAAPDRTPPAHAPVLWLTAAAATLLALLAVVVVLALQLHFEAHDRDLLHRQLAQARQLLARVDNTGALAELPGRMANTFGDQSALAVRIQGALGQPLYEKLPQAEMPPALLARAALAAPAPLVTWEAAGTHWRGAALVMRMPMDGAAPLTVAMATDVERDQGFLARFRLVLIAYVLLATLVLALAAWWTTKR